MNVTDAKVAANQANAQHSTGPKSEAGKATVARNAVKHGLTSKELIVRDDERDEFIVLQAELLDEVLPESAIEKTLFHQLLYAAWNLRRVRRLEAALFDGAADPLADDVLAQKMDRYAKHATRFERMYHRSLKELKAIKTQRAVNDVCFELGGAYPRLLDIPKVLKQSQIFDRVNREKPLDDVLYGAYQQKYEENIFKPIEEFQPEGWDSRC